MIITKKIVNNFLNLLVLFFPILIVSGNFLLNLFSVIFSLYALINFRNLLNQKILDKKIIFFLLSFVIFIFPYDSIDFKNSFIKYLTFTRYVLMFLGLFIFFSIQNNIKKFDYIYKIYLLFLVIISIDIIVEYTTGSNIFGYNSSYIGRIASFTNDELIIGYIFSFIVIFCISYISQIFRNNYIFLIGILLCILISFYIGERANFIKLTLILAIFYILNLKKINITKILVITAVISISSTLFYQFSKETNQVQKFSRLFITVQKSDETNLHSSIKEVIFNTPHAAHYHAAYQIFLNYPMFGIGINNFYNESKKDKYKNRSLLFNNIRSSTHPHQVYFEIISEVGIIGATYFVFVFFYPIIISINNFVKFKNYNLLGHLFLHFFFIFPLIPSGSIFSTIYAIPFWFNLSILVSLNIKIKEKNLQI